MARTPRGGSVPKTSGQDISRSIYKTAHNLKGGAIGGGGARSKVPKGPGTTAKNRDYGKGGMNKSDMNIEFGGMFQAEDVKPLGEGALPKSDVADKRRPSQGWKQSGEQYQRRPKKG